MSIKNNNKRIKTSSSLQGQKTIIGESLLLILFYFGVNNFLI